MRDDTKDKGSETRTREINSFNPFYHGYSETIWSLEMSVSYESKEISYHSVVVE